MRIMSRSHALAGALIAATLVLTGCAEPRPDAVDPGLNSAQSGSPTSGAGPSGDEAALLDALESYDLDTAYFYLARAKIIESCMATRGVSGYPNSSFHNPLLDVAVESKTSEAAALWAAQGRVPNSAVMTPTAQFAKYGYNGVAFESPPDNEHDAEYYAMTLDQQSQVNAALYGTDADGNQVTPPEESCDGEAAAKLGGNIAPFDGLSEESTGKILALVDQIPTASIQSEIGTLNGLNQVTDSWVTCVQQGGFPAAKAPSASGKGEDTTSNPADKQAIEAAFAKAGVPCDEETGLNQTYAEALTTWRVEHIKAVLPELTQYLSALQPRFEAARQYLGVK